jgi:hypothetical protein
MELNCSRNYMLSSRNEIGVMYVSGLVNQPSQACCPSTWRQRAEGKGMVVSAGATTETAPSPFSSGNLDMRGTYRNYTPSHFP